MNCNSICLLCINKQDFKVNHSNFHGLCRKCSISAKSFVKCLHCDTIVLILTINLPEQENSKEIEFKHCANCCVISFDFKTYKDCQHDICSKCFQDNCPLCFTCAEASSYKSQANSEIIKLEDIQIKEYKDDIKPYDHNCLIKSYSFSNIKKEKLEEEYKTTKLYFADNFKTVEIEESCQKIKKKDLSSIEEIKKIDYESKSDDRNSELFKIKQSNEYYDPQSDCDLSETQKYTDPKDFTHKRLIKKSCFKRLACCFSSS